MMRLKVFFIFACLFLNLSVAQAGIKEELFSAVKIGSTQDVARILKDNPNLNLSELRNSAGFSLFHEAFGNKKLVELLLSFDSRLLTSRSVFDSTPLHWATISEDNDILNLLLSFDPKLSNSLILAQDDAGMTPLHWATIHSPKAISALLEFNNTEEFVEATDHKKTSALGFAIFIGRSPSVAAFVRKGASLDDVTIEGKRTSALEFLNNKENYGDSNDRETKDRLKLLQNIVTGRIQSQQEMDWDKL